MLPLFTDLTKMQDEGESSLRWPSYKKEPYRMDIDAFLTSLKCTNNHRFHSDENKGAQEEAEEHHEAGWEHEQPWVQDRSESLSESELELASLITRTAVKIKYGVMASEKTKIEFTSTNKKYKWSKKPVMLLGNKYDSTPSSPATPKLWLIIDSREHRLIKAMGHLPYVLVATVATGDALFLVEDFRFMRPRERKTWMDLKCSTESGHKKRQIAGMHESGIRPSEIEWLIESPSSFQCSACVKRNRGLTEIVETREGGWQAFIHACQSNLTHRDGFSIRSSRGILDTILILLRDVQSLMEFGVMCTRPPKTTTHPDWKWEPFTPDNITAKTDEFLEWTKETCDYSLSPWLDNPGKIQERAMLRAQKIHGARPKNYRESSTSLLSALLACLPGVKSLAPDMAAFAGSPRELYDLYRTTEQAFNSITVSDSDADADHAQSKKSKTSDNEASDVEYIGNSRKRKKTSTPSDSEDDGFGKAPGPLSRKKRHAKKARKKKQRYSSTDQERIGKLCLLLTQAPSPHTKSGKVTPAASKQAWLQLYASKQDRILWESHPDNTTTTKRAKSKKAKEESTSLAFPDLPALDPDQLGQVPLDPFDL